MSLNLGDVVEFTNPVFNTTTQGIITSLGKKKLDNACYVVFDSDCDIHKMLNMKDCSGHWILEKELKFLKSTPFTQPLVYTITIPKFESALVGNVTNKPSNINTCAHEFKTYTGLIKKYDYCTKCDAKKNERGAYEN